MEQSKSASTASGNVYTTQSIKNIGSISLNGNIYHYFLVKVAQSRHGRSREETTAQFNFTSSSLKDGKMIMEIFEGFTFNNFSDRDYNSANITTYFPYPHLQDFDKNKFEDVMVGDVLLAGRQEQDGTVTANKSLRLTGVNLINAIPHHMSFLLPYVAPSVGKSVNNGWCYSYTPGAYPTPVFPCQGTGQITITLLMHVFDKDSTIPSSGFTLQYRLKIYKESLSETTAKLFNQIYYMNNGGSKTIIKRSGNVFYLNWKLSYKPPASCIGFRLEFKQIEPDTALGNESQLFFLVEQEL